MDFKSSFSELLQKYPLMVKNKKSFETTMKSFFKDDKLNCNISIALFDMFPEIEDSDSIDEFLRNFLVLYLVDEHGTQKDAAENTVDIILDVYGHELLGKQYSEDLACANKIKEVEVEEDELETWDDFTKFEYVLRQYNMGNYRYAMKLADCYERGIGVEKNVMKALEVWSTISLKTRDKGATRALADAFYIGEEIDKDIELSKELDRVVDKNANREEVAEAGRALVFQKIESGSDVAFRTESEHFSGVEDSIDNEIEKCASMLVELDEDTSWMDHDQRAAWVMDRQENARLNEKIEEYGQIYLRPYYARMNVVGAEDMSVYIGEKAFFDYNNPANSIYSVWSDMGKQYRARTVKDFKIGKEKYSITLRRKITIKDAELCSIYDEYKDGSDLSETQITDTFLQKVLEEKKKERNITNIIRSIQLNQNNIIEEDMKQDLIVQGCAGSGKTMILLHRLANLRYNRPDYSWSNVRIITPNEAFAFYIDDLSRNLEINKIGKCTLENYLLEILRTYYERHHSAENRIEGWKERFVTRFRDDAEWSKNTGAAEYIYSDEFLARFEQEMKLIGNIKPEFVVAYNACREIVSKILDEKGFSKRVPTSRALITMELLFMKRFFNRSYMDERLLCVDEGQDIPERCYMVLKELSDNRCVFNIFGDLSQRIDELVNASGWDKLIDSFNAKKYELKENYRNSEQIVRFYKKKLGRKDEQGFGIESSEVKTVGEEQLRLWMQIHLILGNRVAYITRRPNEFCEKYPDITSRKIEHKKINVLSVKEAKGLEFDTVFVDEAGLGENDRYVAYTRALSNLFICE